MESPLADVCGRRPRAIAGGLSAAVSRSIVRVGRLVAGWLGGAGGGVGVMLSALRRRAPTAGMRGAHLSKAAVATAEHPVVGLVRESPGAYAFLATQLVGDPDPRGGWTGGRAEDGREETVRAVPTPCR